jgi:hypothetical protein
MAKTILNEFDIPKWFGWKPLNTSFYVLNRVTLRLELKKTPYELWKGRKPNILYFKVLVQSVLFLT